MSHDATELVFEGSALTGEYTHGIGNAIEVASRRTLRGGSMYDSILIPTDGKDGTKPAITHGIQLAAACDATVHALYVVDLPYLSGSRAEQRVEPLEAKLNEEGRDATASVAERARERGLDVTETVATGLPFLSIIEYTDAHDIDLVAMGTEGAGSSKARLVGSTAKKVVRLSKVPVLTVRAVETAPATEYTDVLLATDGTRGSRRAISHCSELAAAYDATVHVVSVVDSRLMREGSGRELMAQQAEQACTDVVARISNTGVATTSDVLHGHPADRILDYADDRDIDLVVLGTHGRSGIDRFVMGSVAETVLGRATTPVLTVRDLSEEE
ncbi:universal stress protein [Haladaptatus paucihalophilus DX253]|uniref:Universal stress protein n=2 Tax=Haladaptatus paucihalophilus DX253 TaxID=797209 RepID=E7QZA7_HALPU|nr:universal stress protein [Haladaptatus paucihalophilus DX253]